jgi:hypothetical protein
MALTQVTPDVLHSNQGNITTVGTLGNLTVTGNISSGNVIATNFTGTASLANNASFLGGTPAASYALGSTVTTANTNMKGYVDAVTTAWTANAGAQAGSIASKANSSDTLYVGTTAVALNRTSAGQTLTGVNIDGSASYASSAGLAASASYAQNAGVADVAGSATTATTATTATSALNAIGVGQTWQNVTGRLVNTTYTNSTGRSIFLSVRLDQDDGTLTLTVDGFLIGRIGYTAGPVYYTLTAIIPSGSTYIVGGTGSSAMLTWHELR